jgi:thioredoxin-like negative regulator of GroEL
MLWPTLSKSEQESGGKWTLIKIDVDNDDLSDIVSRHNITGVPTLAFYRGDKKVFQKTGFANAEEFNALVQKHFN